MKVYHGSDTLKLGQTPDPYFDKQYFNGAFFSPTKEFASEFGSTVHVFEVAQDVIFDLRISAHRRLLEEKLDPGSFKFLELEIVNGLYRATARDSADELRDEAKIVVRNMGFAGWFLCESEWPGKPLSLEIWDISKLKRV